MVRLQDYNFADYLVQNAAVYTPITFEEIVLILVSAVTKHTVLLYKPVHVRMKTPIKSNKICSVKEAIQSYY